MNRRVGARGAAVVVLATGLLAVGVPSAAAHPLGNLSVNTSDAVVAGPAGIRVDHVEDLAEIPALAAVRAADRDGDGTLSEAESRELGRERCAAAAGRVRLAADGVPARLGVAGAAVSRRPGEAGLPLVRVECSFSDPRALGAGERQLDLDVVPVSDLGWREITIAAAAGATIVRSDVPASSPSARLTRYPGPGVAPLDVTQASAVVAPGGSGPAAAPWTPSASAGPAVAWFDAAVRRAFGAGASAAGTSALALMLLAAVALGATHAVAPGHGKTVMAAAVLAVGPSSRWTRVRDAVAIGAAVTGAHTGSVIVLAAVLWGVGAVVPAWLFGGLEALGGLLVVLVGVSLLRAALRRSRSAGEIPPAGHGHGHSHGHGHNHGHGHGHGSDHQERLGGGRILGLGLAGGLTPSPGALLLLLGATAAGHPWAGALAVLAFGIGMAGTLTVVGLAAGVVGERLVRRRGAGPAGRAWADRLRTPLAVTRLSPLLPSLAIVLAGGALVARGVLAV